MDSEHKHKVMSSSNLSNFGIIVMISDVECGFKKGMVLKSISSGLYWEVQSRIIHSSEEKKFEGETEIFIHINIRRVEDLQKRKEIVENNFEYCLQPIGHHEKPTPDDFLVFSSTIAKPSSLKIIDIYKDYFLLDTKNGNTGVLHKKYVYKKAHVGDYVKYNEHMFHDLVDESGKFIYNKI